MRLGPDFSRFGHKDISCRVRNRMLDKIVYRQSQGVFFTVFLQHVSFTLFHLQSGAKLKFTKFKLK